MTQYICVQDSVYVCITVQDVKFTRMSLAIFLGARTYHQISFEEVFKTQNNCFQLLYILLHENIHTNLLIYYVHYPHK